MTIPKIEKHHIIYVILLTLFVLIALGAFYRITEHQPVQQTNTPEVNTPEVNTGRSIPPHTALVTVRDTTYLVDLATTEPERSKGLGGRPTLASNSGMLFVFDVPDQYGFWMKDTLIPLDMIWISADKKIVHIAKNVQPESFPTSYGPDEDALYVLELAAGQSEKNHFADGDEVSISSAELR